MTKHSIDLETTIDGIPCAIAVESFQQVKPFRGSPHLCDSADDFYGYIDVEFTILDRKGYRAKWLDNKLTPEIEQRIINEIIAHREEL